MRELYRRLLYRLNRRRVESELAEEMAAHREMMPAADRANFGSPLQLQETVRELWGWTWLDRLFQDLRYGFRGLLRSPGFTLTAILVLALGIGVNLTAFRLALMVSTPTERDPDTLVHLDRWFPNGHSSVLPFPVLAFYASHAQSFQAMIGVHSDNAILGDTVVGRDPETVTVNFVTANYFGEQGEPVIHGRSLLSTVDEQAGATPVALLSQRFWQERFGGDTGLLGHRLRLNGKPVLVVGILRSRRGPDIGVWMLMNQEPYLFDGSRLLTDWTSASVWATARLKPGISPRTADEESRVLAAQLHTIRPDAVSKDERLTLTPFTSLRLHPEEFAQFLVAVSLVLLILVVACADLGILLLARGVKREHEMRIRLHLGASRRRVIRQLLTENAMLATLSSLAALFFSALAIKLFQLLDGAPESTIIPEWRVMAAAGAITLLAVISFGLAPALRLTGNAPHRRRAMGVFLTVQVAASCILLMISGLLVRSFDRLNTMNPGFDSQKVLTISPGLHAHGYDGAVAAHYFSALSARLLTVPGVERTSVVWLPPWGNTESRIRSGSQIIHVNHVDDNFLRTLGVPLLRGRDFVPGDHRVALVSESFARWRWPGEDATGKTLDDLDRALVVGIVRSADTFQILEEDPMGIYLPLAAADYGSASLVVRVSGKPSQVATTLTAIAGNQNLKLQPKSTLLQDIYEDTVRKLGRLATAIGMLGTLAALLAGIGLAGLTGYTVGQRTREIGVRMALGARGVQVVRSVLRPMLVPVAVGLAGGALGAGAIASVLRSRIFGLRPLDAAGYLMAILLFIAVVAAASFAPVRRAIRIRPAEALRHE